MGWKIGLPSIKLNNARVRSKKCGDFRSIAREALLERDGRDPDIDPARTALNRYEGFKTAAELMEYSRQHVDQLRDAKGRKIRKDAVVMCATVLKPPAAYMATLSQPQRQAFLDDAFDAFVAIVGRENVKSRADHHDEQGSHTHVFWEPMTPDGRLCAKEMHSLQFFGRVNRELPALLREKGWDIEDCDMHDAFEVDEREQESRKTRPAGRSSAKFKADAERERKALEERTALLTRQGQEMERKLEVAQEDLEEIQYHKERLLEDLHLIQNYEEYRFEAADIEETLDLAEALTKELPESARYFKAAAAQTWVDRILKMLQKLRKLIEVGIQRLQIFEREVGVKERLSEPLQERKKGLDSLIAGAKKKAEEAPGRPKEKKKEGNHGSSGGPGVR